MKKKYLIPAVFVLIALNIWRWWPSQDGGDEPVSQIESDNSTLELKLASTIYEPGTGKNSKRDIFNYQNEASEKNSWIQKKVQEYKEEQSKPLVVKKPRKSPGRATSGGKLRLAGVLIKKQNRHAFIISNGKENSLAEGDVLNGMYKVSAISEFSVKLKNLATNKVIVLNL